MVMTVATQYTRWQAKSIPARSDFRGVLLIGLVCAWAFFAWQVMALPPFATVAAGLGPLLRSALDKGQFMPDFGAITAGFLAYHFRREFQVMLDRRVAVRVVVAVVATLLVPLALALALQDGMHLATGQAVVPPWQDALSHIQVRVIATTVVLTILLLPIAVFKMWTATPDIGWSAVVLASIFYGMTFYLHSYRLEWMWSARVAADLVMGLALCATLFRGVEFFVVVRGPAIIIGIMALAGGAILAGPGLFFMGFLMTLGGACLSERTSRLPGEAALLAWSRTAYAIVIAQFVVLTAWLSWGGGPMLPRPLLFILLALVTQAVAVLFYALVERPLRVLLLSTPPEPIK